MDRSPTAALRQPRRLVAAALVSLALASVAFAVAAQSAPAGSALEPGTTFQVAAPRIGDRAQYAYHAEDGAGNRVDRDPYLVGLLESRFEWVDQEPRHDADGDLRRLAEVRLTERYDPASYADVWRNLTVLVDPAVGSTDSYVSRYQDQHTYGSPVPLVPVEPTSDHASTVLGFAQVAFLPCGMRNVFQDGPRDLGGVIPDPYDCSFSRAGPDRSFSLRPVHLSGPAGQRVLVVEQSMTFGAKLGSDDVQATTTAMVTFREDVPYPVRLAFLHGQGRGPIPVSVVDLVGFDRGNAPLDLRDADAGPGLPSIQEAPRTAWGFEEAGVPALAFPLSAAYTQALADRGDLRDFLASHPGAYMNWARGTVYDVNTEVRHAWRFGLTDGTATFALGVTRNLPGAAPLLLPTTPQYQYEEAPEAPYEMRPVPPDQAPVTLPRLADLAQWWTALRGPAYAAAAVESWSFALGCVDSEDAEDGCRPFTAVHVGTERYTMGPTGIVGVGGTWDSSQLVWKDGRPTSLQESVSSFDLTGVSGFLPTAPAAANAATQPIPSADWGMPSTVTVVGIGLGALLVGVLVWAWPAMKAGVGLFSRVQAEELLENPTRAMLVAAVEANPGIHHQELVRIARKGNGAAEHHLQKLVAGGVLARHKSAGYTCYFRAGKVDRRVMASAHLLKSPVARAIVEAAQRSPGTSLAEVARLAGVSVPTVHYHAKRLRAAGLVAWNGGLYPVAAPAAAPAAA